MGILRPLDSLSSGELLEMAHAAERLGRRGRADYAEYSRAYGGRKVAEFRAEFPIESHPAIEDQHPSVSVLPEVSLELVPELETA